MKGFTSYAKVTKADTKEGVVFGWAIICTEKGQPYYDLQGDNISEHEMMTAAIDFMKSSRVAKEMHDGDKAGSVLFALPYTAEVAKSYGDNNPERTGLKVAIHFDDPAIVAKFADGTYTGFSIGGFSESSAAEEVA